MSSGLQPRRISPPPRKMRDIAPRECDTGSPNRWPQAPGLRPLPCPPGDRRSELTDPPSRLFRPPVWAVSPVYGVGAGFGEQCLPGDFVALGDRRPFLERSAGGRERLGVAAVDELSDAFAGQLDDEVAGAVVAAGEERAVDPEARELHEGADARGWFGEEGLGDVPEEGGLGRRRWRLQRVVSVRLVSPARCRGSTSPVGRERVGDRRRYGGGRMFQRRGG